MSSMSRLVIPATNADYHIVGTQAVHSAAEQDDEQNLQGGPSVLDDADRIRSNPIQWIGVEGLTQDEQSLLELFDKMRENRAVILQEQGQNIMKLYITLLCKNSRSDVLQYILTIIMDIFFEFNSLYEFVAKQSDSWIPFYSLINLRSKNEFPYIVYQSSRILSRILVFSEIIPQDQAIFYIAWLRDLSHSEDMSVIELSLNCLRKVLRRDNYRLLFYETGIEDLRIILLSKHVTMQLQYLCIVNLWILSFNPSIASTMDNDNTHIIAAIVITLRKTIKDKIIRVSLATLKNIIQLSAHESIHDGINIQKRYCTFLISLNFLPLLQSWIDEKTLIDEDSVADADYLKTILDETYNHMSTFDHFVGQLHSGEVSWTPVHRSEPFWVENAIHLNDNDYELLKILVQILKSSDNSEMLAVAAHDIGEYVRYYPRGKRLVEELGGKIALMTHMVDHVDAAVRYEAVVATQKIMTHNWEFLGNAPVTKEKTSTGKL